MEPAVNNSRKAWCKPRFVNLEGKETNGGSLGNVSEGGHVTDSQTTFTGVGLLT